MIQVIFVVADAVPKPPVSNRLQITRTDSVEENFL